jgi:hypothetical protein
MNHHHAPRHHRPHLLSARLNELRQLGASEAVINLLINEMAERYSLDTATLTITGNLAELANSLDRKILEQREQQLLGILQPITESTVLVTGEMPPHVIEELVHTRAQITQTHPLGPHGDSPPHLRHFEQSFTNYRHVGSPEDVMESIFTAIVTHGYKTDRGVLVSRHASFAVRVWPQTPLIMFTADHQAPHHLENLGNRTFNLIIPE